MTIETFISNYKNHPILFIGTGVSLRYLKNSYNWNDLLEKVSLDFRGNEEYYYDIKAKCFENGHYKYDKIATLLENDFNTHLEQNREGNRITSYNVCYTKLLRAKPFFCLIKYITIS